MLHAHIGSGPQLQELHDNLTRLAEEFAASAAAMPALQAVSLGGGIPFNYRQRDQQIALDPLRDLFRDCRARICDAAGRALRVEIEPGRYYVAPACTLVTRVSDVKTTRANAKGSGAKFVMVDAGFVDLVRPAMYGSYHEIAVVGAPEDAPREPLVVAGPLCESGDVFTRDDAELLVPRDLPLPSRGRSPDDPRRRRLRLRHELELQLDRPRPAALAGTRRLGRNDLPPRDAGGSRADGDGGAVVVRGK